MLAKARTCSRCGTAFRLPRGFAPARSEPLDRDETEINTASPKFENHPVSRLGIVAQGVYAQAADTISIIDDSKQKVARRPYGASLAACVPASAIREFPEKH